MAQKRVKLQFPFGGVNDALSKSTQQQLTTRDAQNCRAKDPQTGRIRGAQRSGLKIYTSGQHHPFDENGDNAQSPTQAIASIAYDEPRFKYLRLNNWAVGPDAPTHVNDYRAMEWHKAVQGDGSAYSPTVDIQGNVFVITEGRTIHKYNGEGELVDTISIPSSSSSSLVKKVEVDALGNVYAVLAAGLNATGGQLLRWEPDEELGYKLKYNLGLNIKPVTFHLRFNTLWMIAENPYGGPSQSSIQAYGFLDTDAPMRLWSRFVPHPCNAISLSDSGHIYIASGANDDRIPDVGSGVEAGAVGWTPNELYRSAGRIHSWLDAYYLPDIGTGSEVELWSDNRGFVPSEVANFIPIYDTQPRTATNPFPTPGSIAGHGKPVYMANGFADKPSVRFDRKATHNFGGSIGETEVGQAMYFQANASLENRDKINISKTPEYDAWSDQTALIPGASNVVWTMFAVVRLGDQSEQGCLFNFAGASDANGYNMDLQVLVNADKNVAGSGLTIGKSSGKICLRGGVTGASTGSGPLDPSISCISGVTDGAAGDNITASGSADATTQTAIIVLHNNGHEIAGSAFRVNGKTIDTFTLNHGGYADAAAHGSASAAEFIKGCLVGAPYRAYTGATDANAFNTQESDLRNATVNLQNFDGDICEVLVVNGHTQAGGDLSDDSPGDANYSEGGAAKINTTWDLLGFQEGYDDNLNVISGNGGDYRIHYRDASGENDFATEVELIEGYLAHKWGIASTLDDAHPFKTVVPGDFGDSNPSTPTHAYSPLSAFDDWGAFISAQDQALVSTEPITAKYDPSNGDVVWAATGGNMGNGVIADSKGGVYTVGDGARKIIDLGTTFSLSDYGGAQAWTQASGNIGPFANKRVDLKLSLDEETLYVPLVRSVDVAANGSPVGLNPYGRMTSVMTETGIIVNHRHQPENLFIPNPQAAGDDSWKYAKDWTLWEALTSTDDEIYTTAHLGDSRIRIEKNRAANPQGGELDGHALYEVGAPHQGPNWTVGTHETTALGRARFKNLLFPFDQDSDGNAQETVQSGGGDAGKGPSQHMVDVMLDFTSRHDNETSGGTTFGWVYAVSADGGEDGSADPDDPSGEAGHQRNRQIERRTKEMRSPNWDYEATKIANTAGGSSSSASLMCAVPNQRLRSAENTTNLNGKKFIFSCFIKRGRPEANRAAFQMQIQQYDPVGSDTGGEKMVFTTTAYFDLHNENTSQIGASGGYYGMRRIGVADEDGNYWWRCWVSYTFNTSGGGTVDDFFKIRIGESWADSLPGHGYYWNPMLEVVTSPSLGPTKVTVPGHGSNGPEGVGNAAIGLNNNRAIFLGPPDNASSSIEWGGKEQVYNNTVSGWTTNTAWGSKREVWLQFWVKEQPTEAGGYRDEDMANMTLQLTLSSIQRNSTENNYNEINAELRELSINANAGVADGDRISEKNGSYTSYSGERKTKTEYNADSELVWPYEGRHRAKRFDNGWILFGFALENFLGYPGSTSVTDDEGVTTTTTHTDRLVNAVKVKMHPGGESRSSSYGVTNGSSYTTATSDDYAEFFNAEIWGFQLFVSNYLVDGTYFPTEVYYDPGRRGVTGVALPPTQPDYTGSDELGQTTDVTTRVATGPEFAYLTMQKEQGRYGPNLIKQRLVRATPQFEDSQSSRTTKVVTVNKGSLFTVSSGAPGYELVTDGRDVLETDAGQVMSTAHFGKIYFNDGANYVVYDPKTNKAESLEAKTAGEVPKRARLMASYRGRLVLARTVEDPNNYYMSAVGDPENWDYYPATPVVTQAISGTLSRAGKSPDVINALIPYNDDLMLIGGDHSIFRMTGDPAAGGQLDQVTSSVGIAFGESWTMDPEGALYFFTPQGCVYVMTPTGQPQRLSNDAIEKRIQGVDLTKYKVKLVWNQADYGLHVFFLPYITEQVASNDALANSFFWEKGGQAWWPDKFDHNVTPYAVNTINGERPDDRKMLLCSKNGVVLKWDSDSKGDHVYKIPSYATITIAQPQDLESSSPRVVAVHPTMGSTTLNAKAYLLAHDEPSDAVFGEECYPNSDGVAADAVVSAGRNKRLPMRARAPFVELRIQNDAPESGGDVDGCWAIEELRVDIASGGRRRDV